MDKKKLSKTFKDKYGVDVFVDCDKESVRVDNPAECYKEDISFFIFGAEKRDHLFPAEKKALKYLKEKGYEAPKNLNELDEKRDRFPDYNAPDLDLP